MLLKFLKKLLRPRVLIVKTFKGEAIIVDRRCSVCKHEKRAEIEKKLLEGAKYEEIEKEFGVDSSSLSRHFKKHMPRLMFDKKQIEELYQLHVVKQIDLQEEMLKLIDRLNDLFKKLEQFDEKIKEKSKGVSWHAYVESVAERRQILQQIRETLLIINELKSEIKTEKDLSELLQKLKLE